MPKRSLSTRQEQAALTAQLRSQGWAWPEIADTFRHRYSVNARVAFRLAHGFSQKDVADIWNEQWPDDDLLPTSKYLSRWEQWPSPTGWQPSLGVLKRLAEIYQCSVADLVADCADYRNLDDARRASDTAKQGQAEKTVSQSELPSIIEDEEQMERRRLLQSLAALGIAVSPASHALETVRQSVGASFDAGEQYHLDDWEETVDEYGYTYLSQSPTQLVSDLASDLATVLVTVRAIRARHGTNSVQYRGWCRVGGTLSLLMAKTLSNMGHARDAREWWNTARRVVDASGDLELRLWVRGDRIIHGIYENRPPQVLLRQISEAMALAKGHACRGLSSTSSGRAQVLALSGKADEAVKELARTRDIFERLPTSAIQNVGSVANCGEDRIRYTETWVYANIGMEGKTDEAADRAIRLYPSSDNRTPRQIRLIQAYARIQAGDVSEGIRYARDIYESLPINSRTTMINGLARHVLRAIPESERSRSDVRNYRELLTAPSRRAIET